MTLFNLDEYADIGRVIREPEYARSKHLLVKKCKSTWLQFLEQQLRQLSVKDEHFHTHMARIKMDMTEEKIKIMNYILLNMISNTLRKIMCTHLGNFVLLL